MDSTLREQVMINQFVMAVGATREQARQLLQSASWQFETALSIFLQEAVPHHNNAHHPLNHLCTPANTPATPPAFPDALAAFSRMSTQEKASHTPSESRSPQLVFAQGCPPTNNSGLATSPQSQTGHPLPSCPPTFSPTFASPSQPREIHANGLHINPTR